MVLQRNLSIALLAWQTPFGRAVEAPLFEVVRDGAPVPCLGIQAKRQRGHGQGAAAALAADDPARAVDNADSYEYFGEAKGSEPGSSFQGR